MADINQEARIPVYINDEQAKSALKNLTTEAEKWRKKMFEAMEGGDMKGLKEAERELKKVNGQMNSIKKEAFDVNKVLKNISEASAPDLRKALAAVNKEMDGLNRKSKEYKALWDKRNQIKDEFSKINGVVKEQPGFFSKAANAANKYFNMIAIGIAAITGVAFSFGQFVKGMVGLDDSLADVMKTTNLTRKEVRLLYQDFKLLNTRTPRAELLALAEEAGRLGKTGRKDIMAFVEVANKIKIALGDDLGGNASEAIKEVGKLTEIFRVGDQYGTDFKVSMEKMGSGINEVANNSNASAEYLIEYMKRLGGISTQAKISAADIMGYASTFDQLGQNVEMAATAQSKIVVDMFTDPGKYAKIAKMEVRAFSNLLKTDANEAFIKFLEGLNGNNEGLSVMATKLDSLGIDGARATQALASLSSNTKMLREQQDLANGAMEKGISLNNEYAIKNNNLAGSWAKLTTFISTKFINANFLGFLENVIGKLAKMTEVTHPLTKAMQQEVASVNMLTIELTNSNTPAQRRKEIYEELKKIAPDVVANIDAENVSLETLRGNLEKYNAEMIKKLALQDSEETLADKREAAGKATNERIENELKLQKEMNSLLQTYKTFDPQIAKKMEDILFSNETTLNKYKKIVEAVDNVNFSPKTSASLTESLKDEKKATDDVTKSLGAYMERYEMVFGKDKPAPAAPPVTPPAGGNIPPILDSKEIKKASDLAIEALDASNNVIMANLISQYLEQGWTDSRFKTQQLIAEQAYLEEKKKLLLKYGQSTVDVDNQINQKKVETQKEFNSAIAEMEKEDQKEQDEAQKAENAHIDAIVDATKDALDKSKSLQEKEKTQLEERARNYQMISETIVGSLSSMLDGSLDEYATYGDALVLMALQILKQMAPIWAAQIVGGSLATPDSIMTGGVAGIVKFTAMLAIMEGFISIAEGAVRKGIEKKRENASSSKGYYEGGPTGGSNKRKVAGVVHEEEYVIPEEGYNNPKLRPIINLMEIARRNGSLARLDLRPVMASVVTGRGYSSGGPADSSSGSTSAQIILPGSTGMSDATAQKLIKGIDQLVKLKLSIDVKTVKEKMELLDKYENGGLG